MTKGVIIRGVGSFYDVSANDTEYRCRLRGSFREKNITPVVGDICEFIPEGESDFVVTQIEQRKSILRRPFIANASLGIIVASCVTPDLSYFLTDKVMIQLMYNQLETVLVITKADLISDEKRKEITDTYENSNCTVIFVSNVTKEGISELKSVISGHISVLCGVSGAGKSSLVNSLTDRDMSKTGEISKKLKRGKNTTRHSELIRIDDSTYICDTPGFSSFYINEIEYDQIWQYYPEFKEYSDCRFTSCTHITEPDCNVKKAVDEDNISSIRYQTYKQIVEEVKKTNKKYH